MSIAAMLYGPVSSPVDGTSNPGRGSDFVGWLSSASADVLAVVQFGIVIVGVFMALVLWLRGRSLAGSFGVLVTAIGFSWLISQARSPGLAVDVAALLWVIGGSIGVALLGIVLWLGVALHAEGRDKKRAAAAKAPAVAKSPPVEAAVAAEATPAAEEPAPSLVKPAPVNPAAEKKAVTALSSPAGPPKVPPALKGWTVEGALASLPAIDRGRPSWRHAVLVAAVLALALCAGGAGSALAGGLVGPIVAGITLVMLLPLARLVWRRLRRRGGEDSTEFYAAHDAAVQFANAAALARSDAAAFDFWVAMFDAHLVSHPELDRGVWAPEFSRLRRTGLLSSSTADESA